MHKRVRYFTCLLNNNIEILVLASFLVGCVVLIDMSDYLAYFTVGLFVLLIGIMSNPKIIFIILFFALGLFRATLFQSQFDSGISAYFDKKVRLTSEIVNYPEVKEREMLLVVKPLTIQIGSHDKSIEHGLIQVKVNKYEQLSNGQIISFDVVLEKPENFSDFDYVDNLRSKNIHAIGEATNIKIQNNDKGFIGEIGTFRNNIISRIDQSLVDPHSKLLSGMLIGTREQFSETFANSLSVTSTSHVIAVSGYNISLVSNSILSLSGLINRKILIYSSYFFLGVFIVMVGVDNIPAFRAFLMGSLIMASKLMGRRVNSLKVLVFVAMILHIMNPYTYKSLSFQLSFAATSGLMLGTNMVETFLGRILPKRIIAELTTTLTALLATFPITFSSFGKIPVYGLFANVLIAPLVPIITILGVAWLVLGSINHYVSLFLEGLLSTNLEIMVSIIRYLSELPYADLSLAISSNSPLWIFYIALLVLLFERGYRNSLFIND